MAGIPIDELRLALLRKLGFDQMIVGSQRVVQSGNNSVVIEWEMLAPLLPDNLSDRTLSDECVVRVVPNRRRVRTTIQHQYD